MSGPIRSLAALVKRDEGLRLRPYRCTSGVLTIGYGRAIGVRGITRAEAEALLRHDLAEVQAQVRKTWPWSGDLTPARRAVLASMVFQLGLGGTRKFRRTLRSVQEGRYADAARQMQESRWARQTPARVRRLARMMETGTW